MTFDDESSRKSSDGKSAGAAHDSDAPPNLVAFMLRDWEPAPPSPIAPVAEAALCARRREALGARFPGELIVVPSGNLRVRANDEHYPFRVSSGFYYLTGNQEPDCVLLLVPDGGAHRAVLFVEPNPGKQDATFFTDRKKGALWEGARLGVPESAARYAIADTRPLTQLASSLVELTMAGPWRLLRACSAPLDQRLGSGTRAQQRRDAELASALDELRLIKDEHEIAELRHAVAATQRGLEDVIRRMKRATGERELEGVFFTRARMEGNATGYQTIMAAGAHACTLHWRRNDGALRPGELLLVDAGVEAASLYTADITRMLPVDGRFNEVQREIYELVLEAHAAALAAVRPGNDFLDPNRAAMAVLARGLERLGILRLPAEVALREDIQFHRRYTLHNVSHMLGLDVHDCANASRQVYRYGKLVPGMVLTVEPGLYFQPDDATVPPRYRGIGVRIEDDVLVTDTGHELLSAAIPRAVVDVERWIAEIWAAS